MILVVESALGGWKVVKNVWVVVVVEEEEVDVEVKVGSVERLDYLGWGG
jgi:hypothetical protein